VYLLRVVELALEVYPIAKIPRVELPVADPVSDATLDDVADALTQLEYVYLLRVVEPTEGVCPKAKMPTVALPAAAPCFDAVLAAAADALTSPEYVYLSRVVEATQQTVPKANIANVPETIGVALLLAALNADGPKTLVALTLNVYAVQLVSPVTETGDVAPDPALDSGQETAVKLLIAPPPTQAGAVNVTQA